MDRNVVCGGIISFGTSKKHAVAIEIKPRGQKSVISLEHANSRDGISSFGTCMFEATVVTPLKLRG
jgi:hypothetical protein